MRSTLTIALGAACIAYATAQNASFWIARETLGPFYSATDVRTLTPAPSSSTGRLRIDFNDFQGDFYYAIKVTPYIRVNDYGRAQGISIINTWIVMSGFTVYTGFTQDESGFNNDDRKNARSHPITGFSGQTLSIFDGAGNAPDYRNHDLLWWQRGGNVAGPAAFGKVIFDECEFLPIGQPHALYSFVALVPRQLGVYRMGFNNLRFSGVAITDTTLKTAVLTRPECLSEGDTTWEGIVVEGGDFELEVVPEPSSVLMLGSVVLGLAGAQRVRRRR